MVKILAFDTETSDRAPYTQQLRMLKIQLINLKNYIKIKNIHIKESGKSA